MNEAPTITRAELVAIIDRASERCIESTRVKLRKVAETTDAVAAGWWHCSGVDCPARQAKRRNYWFQEAYDRMMAERFNRPIHAGAAFVVRVEG